MATRGSQLPKGSDLLCVPAHPALGSGEPGVELRRLSTGETVASAFSSPTLLVAELGEHQPWVGLPAAIFGALAQAWRVDHVR
ncbi:SAV_915 family protein [Streptacidiphilus fuscans]|uniref:Uncharacterized protein n=1 Tax=Streptacidiphilus fuscans TaxID=2789292 RepID=A0A931AWW9_9ACTN|nr:SAV_915 family protein [Streptacidiphilus fuscans]MBF9066884.1 hypothetical protein [Streptacidiphilus fuscans]